MITVSAKAATARPRWTTLPPRERRVPPSGWLAVMRASELAHSDHSPRMHQGQVPHGAQGVRTTWSPTARLATPGPTASTTPAASWPSTIGRMPGKVPSTTLRSLWQTPQWATRTATSPWRGSSASTSSCTTNGAPTSSSTAARMVPLVLLGVAPGPRWRPARRRTLYCLRPPPAAPAAARGRRPAVWSPAVWSPAVWSPVSSPAVWLPRPVVCAPGRPAETLVPTRLAPLDRRCNEVARSDPGAPAIVRRSLVHWDRRRRPSGTDVTRSRSSVQGGGQRRPWCTDEVCRPSFVQQGGQRRPWCTDDRSCTRAATGGPPAQTSRAPDRRCRGVADSDRGAQTIHPPIACAPGRPAAISTHGRWPTRRGELVVGATGWPGAARVHNVRSGGCPRTSRVHWGGHWRPWCTDDVGGRR